MASLTGVGWNLSVVLICISFMARDGEHFFTCFWPSEFLLLRKLFTSAGHVFIGSLIWGEFSYLGSLYILVISTLFDVNLSNIFSNFLSGLFSLETISFVVQKLFNFMKSHWSILSLSCWAIGVLLSKSLPITIGSRIFPALSYTNFRVSDLKLSSLIHYDFIPVQGDKYGSSFRYLHKDNQFSQ
jgi:hypothetical protein